MNQITTFMIRIFEIFLQNYKPEFSDVAGAAK